MTAVALLLMSSSLAAEVRVIDADTKRAVPPVELTTANHVRPITDNAGRVSVWRVIVRPSWTTSSFPVGDGGAPR